MTASVILFSSKSRMRTLLALIPGRFGLWSWRSAFKRVFEQRTDRSAIERPWVGVGVGDREISSQIERLMRHAEFFERPRCVELASKIKQALGGSRGAQHRRQRTQSLRGSRLVVGQSMRQDDGVGFAMRKIETSGNDVAAL